MGVSRLLGISFLAGLFALGSTFHLTASISMQHQRQLIRIPQSIWRQASHRHQEHIHRMLAPGLTAWDNPLNSGLQRNHPHPNSANDDSIRALDPRHPIYNFLIEYYGLKGVKGPRRLARWSPSPGILLQDETTKIESLEQLDELSSLYTAGGTSSKTSNIGVVLEDVVEDDFADNLHIRGASIEENGDVIYSPSLYFGKGDESRSKDNTRLAAPFLWYRSILEQTISSEPILHCYGLHEWAMQYQPENAPPPPSAQYQKHLPLRVSRKIINDTVERKGISCTHVDALRFFAQDALPLNHFGGPLERNDQVRLEQSGCVHAHMDLLKMALKLQSFCDPILLERVLEVALEARTLDVAASPYDASSYGVGVVAVDTPEGRAEYRTKQRALMKRVEPVRQNLLSAYNTLIALAFDDLILKEASHRLPKNRPATSS